MASNFMYQLIYLSSRGTVLLLKMKISFILIIIASFISLIVTEFYTCEDYKQRCTCSGEFHLICENRRISCVRNIYKDKGYKHGPRGHHALLAKRAKCLARSKVTADKPWFAEAA